MSRKNFKGGADALFEKTTPPTRPDDKPMVLPVDELQTDWRDSVEGGLEADVNLAKAGHVDDEPVDRTFLDVDHHLHPDGESEGVYFVNAHSIAAILKFGFQVKQDTADFLTVIVGEKEVVLSLGEGITKDGEKLDSI